MAEVFWLEQRQDDLPGANDWLGARELSVLNSLVFLKRRNDWRLGRWTAKCAFAHTQRIAITPDALAGIEIRAAASGAPQLFHLDRPQPAAISISHCAQSAICAITASKIPLGCDLERIEPRTTSFLEDYFTPAEQTLVARAPVQDHQRLTTLLWSAKESTLKALQLGLRVDTRSVQIQLPELQMTSWTALSARTAAGDVFQGWWSEADGMIRTIVAGCAIGQPIQLQLREPTSIAGLGRTLAID